MKYPGIVNTMKQLDNYILNYKIGQGQFGEVYYGTDTKSQEVVAVKQIRKADLKGKIYTLFESEITILKTVRNNFILLLKDILKSTNNIYLVTEYCEGGDLQNHLKSKGRLPEPEVLRFFVEILEGFRALREHNILHRDLKLANLLLKEGHIKIADFGFSKIMLEDKKAKTVLGSPLNMAPEVLREEEYDSKADVYSIGVCLFQLIFGNYPFKAEVVEDLLKKIYSRQPAVDPAVEVSAETMLLIMKMLEPDPKARLTFEDLFALQPKIARALGLIQ